MDLRSKSDKTNYNPDAPEKPAASHRTSWDALRDVVGPALVAIGLTADTLAAPPPGQAASSVPRSSEQTLVPIRSLTACLFRGKRDKQRVFNADLRRLLDAKLANPKDPMASMAVEGYVAASPATNFNPNSNQNVVPRSFCVAFDLMTLDHVNIVHSALSEEGKKNPEKYREAVAFFGQWKEALAEFEQLTPKQQLLLKTDPARALQDPALNLTHYPYRPTGLAPPPKGIAEDPLYLQYVLPRRFQLAGGYANDFGSLQSGLPAVVHDLRDFVLDKLLASGALDMSKSFSELSEQTIQEARAWAIVFVSPVCRNDLDNGNTSKLQTLEGLTPGEVIRIARLVIGNTRVAIATLNEELRRAPQLELDKVTGKPLVTGDQQLQANKTISELLTLLAADGSPIAAPASNNAADSALKSGGLSAFGLSVGELEAARDFFLFYLGQTMKNLPSPQLNLAQQLYAVPFPAPHGGPELGAVYSCFRLLAELKLREDFELQRRSVAAQPTFGGLPAPVVPIPKRTPR